MTFYFHPRERGFRMQAFANAMNEFGREFDLELFLPLDLKTTSDGFELKAFLPGVNPDDISIQIVNGVLTFSGEIKVERRRKK